MNIGDLVVRAYAWHAIIPGIVVDIERENVVISEDRHYGAYEYESVHYVVKWSDGMLTTEMYEELEPLAVVWERI